MNFRYVRSSEERNKGELCIDTVDGFLAPSWQAKNYVAYRVGSKIIKDELGINQYKTELLYFWREERDYTTEEEREQAENALKLMKRLATENIEDVCFITPSGGPTKFTETFVNFINWIKKETDNDS